MGVIVVVTGTVAGISTAMAIGGLLTFNACRAVGKDGTLLSNIAALMTVIGVVGMLLSTLALNILILLR